MGQVIVTFAKPLTRDRDGGAQMLDCDSAKVEELDSSSTSAATTITAGANDAARVVNNTEGLVWVKFGPSPTAAVEDMHPVLSGGELFVGGLGAGFKCAVIDDS